MGLTKRSGLSKGRPFPSVPKLHFELWVALRKDRARMSRITRSLYRVARRITQDGGASGPWLFLVDQDPPNPKTRRLRKSLGLKPHEDLWMELVFYPNRVRMKTIIKQIWKQPQVNALADTLDSLLSKRRVGYRGTIAYAGLRAV